MGKRPLTAVVSYRNTPAHEKFNFIVILLQYFNLHVVKGKFPIISITMLRFYEAFSDAIPPGMHGSDVSI